MQVQLAHRDHKGILVTLGILAPQDHRVHKAVKETGGLQVSVARREKMVPQDHRENVVIQVLRDRRERWDLRDPTDQLVTLAQQVLVDQPVQLERGERTENKDLRVRQGQLVHVVQLDHRALREQEGLLVNRDQEENQDHEEQLVVLVMQVGYLLRTCMLQFISYTPKKYLYFNIFKTVQDLKGQRDHRAELEVLDQLDLRAQKAQLDLKDQKDLKVTVVSKDPVVSQGQVVSLALLVPKVQEGKQDLAEQ